MSIPQHTGLRWYRSAGLNIASVIPLDELARPVEPNGAPDLIFERMSASYADSLMDASAHIISAGDDDTPMVEIRRTQDAYVCRWLGRIDMVIPDDGTRVLVCERGPIEDSVPRLLLNQALSFTLGAHGKEGLHASAVEIGGRAVCISGPSGGGKSTLATALCMAGGRLLSDDVVAISLDADGHPFVEPSTTRTWLAPELADELVGPEGHADAGRMHKVAAHDFDVCEDAVPLADFYLLSYGKGAPAIDVALTPKQSIAAILNASFNIITRDQRTMETQFEIAAAIANHSRVRVLHWSRGSEQARIVAQRMIEDSSVKGDAMSNVTHLNGNGNGSGNGHADRQSQRAKVIEMLRAAGIAELPDEGHDEPLLRTSQVAALLRSSDRTIRTWADAGKLKYIKTLGGRRLFPASAVLAVLETMRGHGGEAK